ncbi:MAG: putative solute-binding protein [Thalassolituus sp.]
MDILLRLLICAISLFSVQTLYAAEPPVSPERHAELRKIAMNSDAELMDRILALKEMYRHMLNDDGSVPSRIVCIWDPIGKNGPIYAAAQDQVTRLLEWDIYVDLRVYTNEAVLTEDFKAGQCDAALMTGMRARSFNKYTGTLDAIGALPETRQLKLLFNAITQPKNSEQMVSGNYVVMGYAPAGAAYIFVNDRSITSLNKAAGKRVAVMDYDPIQAEMVQNIGANPVPVSIVSAGPKFNNHAVDVLPAPLGAYQVFELHKGLGDNGGIINYPFTQLTVQMIGKLDRIPNEVAQLAREEFVNNFDRIIERVNSLSGDIPEHLWIEIPVDEKAEYQTMMQQARIALRQHDYYDPTMLTLQRKVRCRFEPDHFECANPVE